jgi:hypothetical protein
MTHLVAAGATVQVVTSILTPCGYDFAYEVVQCEAAKDTTPEDHVMTLVRVEVVRIDF